MGDHYEWNEITRNSKVISERMEITGGSSRILTMEENERMDRFVGDVMMEQINFLKNAH